MPEIVNADLFHSGFFENDRRIIDIFYLINYNIFNKGADSQCTPSRRQNKTYKDSALVYQTGALFFVSKNRNNKGYDCTKHNYKREQVRVCNHITSSFQCVRQLVQHLIGSLGKYIIVNVRFRSFLSRLHCTILCNGYSASPNSGKISFTGVL